MTILSCSLGLVVAATGIVRVETVVDDSVDLIEINHVIQSDGRAEFTQIIFYDWVADEGRFQIRTWRMHKQVQRAPYFDGNADRYTLRFYDKGLLREVHSKSVRHTWTNYDPEVAERKVLPVHKRRGLSVQAQQLRATASPEPILSHP